MSCCGVKRTSRCSRASRLLSTTLTDIKRQEVHQLEKRRDDEAVDDEDEEVEEASWWRAWPLLLLLLLAMVAMGKADGRVNSEVSLMLRLQRESPNASPNEFLPPPPLSPPAAISNPTP
jgi:hypothetical protein